MAKSPKVQLVIDGKDNTKEAFVSVDKGLLRISASAVKAGAAIAGAFAITTAGVVAKLVKDSIDAADAMSKMASGAGVSTEALSGMSWAAGQSGVDIKALATAMGRLNKGAATVESGVGAYADVFGFLGISATNASGDLKSADQLLLEIADSFEKMPDGAQKSAIAMELFGRSGAQMIPFLNAGASGISELTAQAERLGLVLSSEQASASEQFNDNLSILGATAKGTGNILAGELLPALNEFSGLLVDIAEDGESVASMAGTLSGVMKILASVAIILGGAFQATGSMIGALSAAFFAFASGDFSGAASILKLGMQDYYDTTKTTLERVSKLYDGTYEREGKQRAKELAEKRKAGNEEKAFELQRLSEIKTIKDQMLEHNKDRNKKLLTEEKKHLSELEKLKTKELEIESRYKSAIATLSGGSEAGAEPSYGAANALKVKAKQARAAGDGAGAREAASAALEMLLAMKAAGQSAYGLAGFAKELEEIEKGSISDDKYELEDRLHAAKTAMELLNKEAQKLKGIPISVELDDASFEEARSKLQGLAEQARSPDTPAATGPLKMPASEVGELKVKMAPEIDVPATQRIFQEGLNSFTDTPTLAVQADLTRVKDAVINENIDLPSLDIDAKLDEEAVSNLNTALEEMIAKLKAIAVVPVTLEVAQEINLSPTNTVPQYAAGGSVRGPGSGTSDSILARLSNGEYVMRAAAVRKYGTNLLDNLNGLNVPKFSNGGAVGQVESMSPQAKSIGTLNFNLPGGDSFSVDVAGTSSLDDLHRAALKFGRTRS